LKTLEKNATMLNKIIYLDVPLIYHMHPIKTTSLSLLFSLACFFSYAQTITGVWRGRINNQKVEVKIIQQGDVLTGSSYYYGTKGNYRRFSIKGYFDRIPMQ
jgi:hypothetical protein